MNQNLNILDVYSPSITLDEKPYESHGRWSDRTRPNLNNKDIAVFKDDLFIVSERREHTHRDDNSSKNLTNNSARQTVLTRNASGFVEVIDPKKL